MIAVLVDSTGVIMWPQQPDMQAKANNADAELPLFMISNVARNARFGRARRLRGMQAP